MLNSFYFFSVGDRSQARSDQEVAKENIVKPQENQPEIQSEIHVNPQHEQYMRFLAQRQEQQRQKYIREQQEIFRRKYNPTLMEKVQDILNPFAWF